MMRSDMPKQIMAYRNGGGLPSLATAPGNFSTGGGIGSFVSNAYNKAVGVITNALGMNDDKSYAPELTTQPGPESNQMSAKEKFDSNPARQASVRRKKKRKRKPDKRRPVKRRQRLRRQQRQRQSKRQQMSKAVL